MKKVFLFFGILFFGILAKAQSSLPKNTSDSLWLVWTDIEQPDTARLKAMLSYGQGGYLYKLPDSCFYFIQLAYDFASSKNLKNQMAAALKIQGNSFVVRSNYAKAFEYYSQSLELSLETGNKMAIAGCYHGIGSVYSNQGDHLQAINYLKNSLAIYEELKSEKDAAMILNDIGVNYVNQGYFEIGIDYYNRSLVIRLKTNDKRGIGACFHNLGVVYASQGNFTKAIDSYSRSLLISEERGDNMSMAASLNNIGLIYADQGDDETAFDFYNRSLKIKQEIGDKKGIANSLQNIGLSHSNKGDFVTALDYYNRSLKIFEEVENKLGIGRALNNIGNLYQLLKENDNAISYYAQSLEIRKVIGDKKGMASSKINIGSVYNTLRNYALAIQYNTEALTLAIEVGAVQELKNAAGGLYLSYLKLNEPLLAISYLSLIKKSRETDLDNNYFTLPEREKELYFATMERDFGRYYDFTVFYHDTFPLLADTAYNIALMTKGMTLKSSTAMRSALLNSGDSTLIADYENWIQLKRKIANLYSKGSDTEDLENQANDLEKKLVKGSTLFSDFDKVKNLDWKQIRSSLEPGACAIEFTNFKSDIDTTNEVIYSAFVVKPESEHPQVVRLCTETDLIEILGTFQGNNLSFVNSIYGTKKEARTALYQKIWQPLEKYLDGVKTIYYSPSGLLHKISFASISKTQNVFLSDLYNFRQMGSTGKVALPDDVAFGEMENFLLMGGVNYNSQNSSKEVWSYLPGSLQETESINSFLQKKKFGVNYFHSNNASEEIFKEKIVSSSIVHIATHGFFFPDPEVIRKEMKTDSESDRDLTFRGDALSLSKGTTNYANWSFVNNKNPLMRSGIVLANANNVWERDALAEGEDGILTAQEVSNLDLRNTKLVVLSACETGLGDIHGSEGVFGLQRAFKMAGVKYLIMSLWQVPDKETSEFMQLFYRNLIKEKDIPIAFQKTQKVMRQKYDPYFWGAFVLIE